MSIIGNEEFYLSDNKIIVLVLLLCQLLLLMMQIMLYLQNPEAGYVRVCYCNC